MNKSISNTFLGFSIFYIVLGLAMIIWPQSARTIICIICGIIALLYGLVRIVLYFLNKSGDIPLQFGFMQGMMGILLGLLLLIKPDVMITVFGIIIAVAIISDCIIKLQVTLDLKQAGYNSWIRDLVCICVMLVLGILMLFNPFKGVAGLTVFAGISLLLNGIMNILVIIDSQRLLKS